MKTRSDNVLAQLSEEQQDQLYDWIQTLGYTRTLEKVAAPPPDGFGLKTYRASLHRFFVRHSIAARQSDSEIATELKGAASTAPVIRQGTEQAVQHSAFHLATSPHGAEELNQLSRWVLKQKAHDQKQEYLEIARQHLALAEKRLRSTANASNSTPRVSR